jgi:hypothetical protein
MASLFPTTPGAYARSCDRASCGFLTRLNAAGSALVYSTLTGGLTRAIAVDSTDRAHAAVDALVMRFDAAGSRIEYETTVQGNTAVVDLALADGGATIWLCGFSQSGNLPTTPDALKPVPEGADPTLIAIGMPASALVLELPGPKAAPTFDLSGWAIDRGSAGGPGVDAVHVYAFPNPGSGAPPIFLGAAAVGMSRPDIASQFGAQFANAGWQLPARTLSPGFYLLAVLSRSTVTGAFDTVATRFVTVAVPVPQPMLSIDLPAPGAIVGAGTTLGIGGWAIDRGAFSGTGVDAIHVWIFPSSGPPFFGGVATYGISRPDIGAIFGTPFTASGYALAVTGLAPGTYVVAVCAHSTVTNTFSGILTRAVTIQ